MNNNSLLNEYLSLQPNLEKLFVVPKINIANRNTDYLCQLYSEFLSDYSRKLPHLKSLSAIGHYRLFFSRLHRKKSVLHYHWFEVSDLKSFAGFFWKIFWILVYKTLGGKIIWTVHNKYPHTARFKTFNKYIRVCFANLADKLHVHCNSAVKVMSQVLKSDKQKFFIIEHPNFPAEIFNQKKAIDELAQKYPALEINADRRIFLMFGNISEYKGIVEVAKIFTSLSTSCLLLIAGPVKSGDRKYADVLNKKFSGSQNIKILAERIPDENVPALINAVDYMLFNFKEILTSGGVYLAKSYNKKMIIPAKGCLVELNGENIIKFECDDKADNLKSILENLTK